MPKPISNFSFSKTGLTLSFINTSLYSPTSHQWDFGDGTNSTDKNPTKVYTEEGYYTVKLITTNTDGISDPLTMDIGVSQDNSSSLSIPLLQLTDNYLPTTLREAASINNKINLNNKWQLFLQPLLDEPFEVDVADTHNELKWPALCNFLIAQLTALDIIIQGANQFISSASQTGGTTTDNDSGTSTTVGQVKSIETGPAKTEFYENKDESSNSETIKNIGDALKSAIQVGGALDQLKISICEISNRVNVHLGMCGEPPKTYIPFNLFKKEKDTGHNANPFGITDRML